MSTTTSPLARSSALATIISSASALDRRLLLLAIGDRNDLAGDRIEPSIVGCNPVPTALIEVLAEAAPLVLGPVVRASIVEPPLPVIVDISMNAMFCSSVAVEEGCAVPLPLPPSRDLFDGEAVPDMAVDGM